MKTESPCMNICALDSKDICVGCFRTRGEIARWSQISDFAKAFINDVADERRQRHLQNPGDDEP